LDSASATTTGLAVSIRRCFSVWQFRHSLVIGAAVAVASAVGLSVTSVTAAVVVGDFVVHEESTNRTNVRKTMFFSFDTITS